MVIAIHRKLHTVLRRLAVQLRTVFGDATQYEAFRWMAIYAQDVWRAHHSVNLVRAIQGKLLRKPDLRDTCQAKNTKKLPFGSLI